MTPSCKCVAPHVLAGEGFSSWSPSDRVFQKSEARAESPSSGLKVEVQGLRQFRV